MATPTSDAEDAGRLVAHAPWALLLSAAAFAYIVRLLERVKSRKVRSWLVELLEFARLRPLASTSLQASLL